MISLSGGFYVTVTFQSAISQIITRVQPPARIVGIILILIPAGDLEVPTNLVSLSYSSSRRPSRARARVISSAYSRSPPMGRPKAIRVTRVNGLSS